MSSISGCWRSRKQELLQRCHLEAERDALAELRLQMA
jgi:hypothetical protein